MRLKTFGGTATGASAQMPEPAAPAAKPLGTIPWPKPGLSETERKSAATGTAEPPQPAQKNQRNAAHGDRQTHTETFGQCGVHRTGSQVCAAHRQHWRHSAAAAQRPAASRLAGSDAEPSIVDFHRGSRRASPRRTDNGHKGRRNNPGAFRRPTAAPAPSRAAAQPRVDVLTLLQMLRRLDAAMEDAQRAFKGRNCPAVGEAATRIATIPTPSPAGPHGQLCGTCRQRQ